MYPQRLNRSTKPGLKEAMTNILGEKDYVPNTDPLWMLCPLKKKTILKPLEEWQQATKPHMGQ